MRGARSAPADPGPRAWCAAAPLLLLLLCACTAALPVERYSAEELRAELRRRLPDVPEQDLVVPFEVNGEAIERARQITRRFRLPSDQVRALVDGLSDPDDFGLSYTWAINNSAARTLEAGGGTCMGLSSLLVGLTRGLGLDSYYLDASRDVERHSEREVNVVAGHVAAIVFTEAGPLLVDFTGELSRSYRYRRMSDVEAAAHYYNNLGYEIIHLAEKAGQPPPWQEVSRQFARATRVAPGLARAWNNLGVASVRLGQFERAERSYQQALRIDPGLESPKLNLAQLVTRGVPILSLTEDPDQASDRPLSPALRSDPDLPAAEPAPAIPPSDPGPR